MGVRCPYCGSMKTRMIDNVSNPLNREYMCDACHYIFMEGELSPVMKEREELAGNKQEAKADAGKPPLSMVPLQLLEDISWVRKYGNIKYGDPENWKTVDSQRYIDAAFRHFVAYIRDPYGLDEESGLPHLWHLECNIAFLAELEHMKFDLKQIIKNMEEWNEKSDIRSDSVCDQCDASISD